MDKRVLERNITKGLISKEQYERHLADLPDTAGNCEVVEIEPADASEATEPE